MRYEMNRCDKCEWYVLIPMFNFKNPDDEEFLGGCKLHAVNVDGNEEMARCCSDFIEDESR